MYKCACSISWIFWRIPLVWVLKYPPGTSKTSLLSLEVIQKSILNSYKSSTTLHVRFMFAYYVANVSIFSRMYLTLLAYNPIWVGIIQCHILSAITRMKYVHRQQTVELGRFQNSSVPVLNFKLHSVPVLIGSTANVNFGTGSRGSVLRFWRF